MSAYSQLHLSTAPASVDEIFRPAKGGTIRISIDEPVVRLARKPPRSPIGRTIVKKKGRTSVSQTQLGKGTYVGMSFMSTENNFTFVGNVDDTMMVCKRGMWDQCGIVCETNRSDISDLFAESSLFGLHPEREKLHAHTRIFSRNARSHARCDHTFGSSFDDLFVCLKSHFLIGCVFVECSLDPVSSYVLITYCLTNATYCLTH